jgi:hypothetical protein
VTGDAGAFFEDVGQTYVFEALLRSLEQYTRQKFPEQVYEHPDHAVNEYVRNYGMVIAMIDHEGNKTLISPKYWLKIPPAFQDRIRSFLQIMPDDTVLWAEDVFKTPQPAPARETIYGERPEKPSKAPSRKATEKKWQHPDALTPEEMSFLTGKSTKPPTT